MLDWLNYGLVGVATYYITALVQTYLHKSVSHRRRGGKFFFNHVTCHHRNYRGRRMVSESYIKDDLNVTPWFLPPALFIVGIGYLALPLDLFIVHASTMATAFWAHVYVHVQYHLDGSWLSRFRWFRRKRRLHFIHHRRMNTNFAVIEFVCDKWLGTFHDAAFGDEYGLSP